MVIKGNAASHKAAKRNSISPIENGKMPFIWDMIHPYTRYMPRAKTYSAMSLFVFANIRQIIPRG
jgi:hypothetical protein